MGFSKHGLCNSSVVIFCAWGVLAVMVQSVFSLLLARHLHFLFRWFNMWMNCRGKGFDYRIPWDQEYDLILILVSSGIFFYHSIGNTAPLTCLKFALKEKIFGDFCCLNFVTVWEFCVSVVCVGCCFKSLIYFSCDVYSSLDVLFCLMLWFISPSSLLCVAGIIQLLRAVSSFLLLSQLFSTSLSCYLCNPF